MIDLHLKIDENNYDFFIELIKKFDFVEIEQDNDTYLTKKQKEVIEKRKNELLNGEVKGIEWSEIEKILL